MNTVSSYRWSSAVSPKRVMCKYVVAGDVQSGNFKVNMNCVVRNVFDGVWMKTCHAS